MDAIKTGNLIAQVRREREQTQKDLAEALHVSTQAVSKWERGLSCPDIALLEPLAEALDLTVTELLSGQRGEEPGEEAVRDSLRFGENQLRPKIRRWKGLFLCAAALLLAMALGFGYLWVRDNTEWIPQRETVFTPIELEEEQNALVDLLTAPNGRDFLRMYRAVLADDMDRVAFRAELWSRYEGQNPELIQSSHLGTLYAREDGMPGSRRQLVTFRLTFLEDGEIQYKLRLGGSSTSSRRPLLDELPRPVAGVGWGTVDEPVTVDREEGAVLLKLDLGLEPEEGQNVMGYDYKFVVKAYWE